MARGRKPMPEEFKKQKLTLSCKRENIEYLNAYCNSRGTSISQLLDDLAEDLQATEQKQIARDARAARKADKENEQLDGQMSTDDFGL